MPLTGICIELNCTCIHKLLIAVTWVSLQESLEFGVCTWAAVEVCLTGELIQWFLTGEITEQLVWPHRLNINY